MFFAQIFKSNKYYYIGYDRTIKIRNLDMSETSLKISFSNVLYGFSYKNNMYLVNTTGKIIVFNEEKNTSEVFYNIEKELKDFSVSFAFLSYKYKSIFILGCAHNLSSLDFVIYKINCETKTTTKVFVPDGLKRSLYYYDDNYVKVTIQNKQYGKKLHILTYSLDDLTLLSSEELDCDHKYMFLYLDNKYDYSSFGLFTFTGLFDKQNNQLIKRKKLHIKRFRYVFSYDKYYVFETPSLLYITDSEFNILKIIKSRIYTYWITCFYIDDNFVIYRDDMNDYSVLKKDDFLSKKLTIYDMDT